MPVCISPPLACEMQVCTITIALLSAEYQTRLLPLCKAEENLHVVSQQHLDDGRCAVAEAQPNEFRRRAGLYAKVVEVGVLRNERESVNLCVLPNFVVTAAAEPGYQNLFGPRKDVG